MISDKELLAQLEAKIAKDAGETKRHSRMAYVTGCCITAAGLIAMAAIVWEKVG